MRNQRAANVLAIALASFAVFIVIIGGAIAAVADGSGSAHPRYGGYDFTKSAVAALVTRAASIGAGVTRTHPGTTGIDIRRVGREAAPWLRRRRRTLRSRGTVPQKKVRWLRRPVRQPGRHSSDLRRARRRSFRRVLEAHSRPGDRACSTSMELAAMDSTAEPPAFGSWTRRLSTHRAW